MKHNIIKEKTNKTNVLCNSLFKLEQIKKQKRKFDKLPFQLTMTERKKNEKIKRKVDLKLKP